MLSLLLLHAVVLSFFTPAIPAALSSYPQPTVDEATEFSLIYGYPLLPYAQFAAPLLAAKKGPNRLDHLRVPKTPANQDVVRPNVDTLYSHAVIDLSISDLVIEVPNILNRYWVFPFYDIYGNNYANLGSVNQNTPGKYRIRYAHDIGQEPGVQLCSKQCDGYQGFINAPTIYGSFDGRLVVKNNAADLHHVHSLQNQTALYPVSGTQRQSHIPRLTQKMLNGSLCHDIPTRILQLTARFAPFNPARNLSDQHHVNCMLQKAGILHGYYTPTGANVTELAHKAHRDVLTFATSRPNMVDLKNDWYEVSPFLMGDYHKNYKMRYFVAYFGYLGLTAKVALYPSYRDPSTGGNSALVLDPKQAYTITFKGKPPLVDAGFWSVTAYNSEQFLIENSLNRYNLGDRSNLTYPDGSLVYGSNSKNESFQILVQPADLPPPKNWTRNWLPAPAGGGELFMTFRLFGASDDIINGHWEYPLVQKNDAIIN